MNYGRAALQGAASGAMIGLVFGLIFWLLDWFAPAESVIVLGLYGVLIGAFWGTILGLLGQWMTRGARDFDSVSAMAADTYDVTAPPERAAEARRVLSELGLAATTP
jgi:xanthosine utilization system XapX-like protein